MLLNVIEIAEILAKLPIELGSVPIDVMRLLNDH